MPKTFINTVIDVILSRPRPIFGVVMLFTLVFLYGFFQQSHNNHIEVFFESGDSHPHIYSDGDPLAAIQPGAALRGKPPGDSDLGSGPLCALREKFNIITNTMGAILLAIAIAVDDTIHFIAWLRRNSGLKEDAGEAVIQTFADVGKPIVMTTLLLFCGFFVLFLGSILPTKMFGMLTAFAMGFAMIGDMFVLTPLVLIFKPKLPPLPVHGDN